MKLAEITNGVVTNIIKVDPDKVPDWAADWPDATGAQIGGTYANGIYGLPPAPDPATKRAAMVCSRLQGRLVLGQATCDALDAIAADETTPWAMRQTILHAIEWRRTSQAMTELGYLLGYTDTQMDELFEIAMEVEV